MGTHGRHGDIEQPAAAGVEGVDAGAGRSQAGERIGSRIGTEERAAFGVRDESARRRRIVAEGDPIGIVARPSVPGDGDPHLRSAGRHQLGRVQTELR